MSQDLARTPLYGLHLELGAKMVPFSGYEMPVSYAAGILAEHHHTRSRASLFDVSHMGQARLGGEGAAAAFERLVPGDIAGLGENNIRYTQLTDEKGGIIDDLMATRRADHLFLVVNAGCKEGDFDHIRRELGADAPLDILDGHALIALQGPDAAKVLARHLPAARDQKFMSLIEGDIAGAQCLISRSGYTGEDGFEISVPGAGAEEAARLLLSEDEVAPAGLGARDSLRLEAGLCLYGHDIDIATNPVEAGLSWSIGKRRREEGGFPGAEIILDQLKNGPARRRVGLKLQGRAPAREGADIVAGAGEVIGKLTSGGFGPTINCAIAMGYVDADHAAVGGKLGLIVRGKRLEAEVVKLPFVAHNYFLA
ncbi:MAG: glycine cleavage system aminomethyltransferase GcvT [Rhodospirillales bacterium]|nr:glycine cleavage system aminomethyltransferase GcvT [Rhodospirillales bacterium]